MQIISIFSRFLRLFIGLVIIHVTAVSAETIQTTTPFTESKAVQQFIQHMVSQHQFSANELSHWFQKITPNTKIIDLIEKPAENLPWHAYRERVLTEERIRNGVAFWTQHEAAVKAVSQQFGISPEILVAILGLESSYGKITGNFSVFEALSTLAFQYPRRAAFFKKELAQYLLLTREEGVDPLSIKGSYAGAMGPAQFMPSSYRQYAVGFNESANRDILRNVPNILSSIANYFKSHGWQPNAPVAYSAQVSGTRYQKFQNQSKPSMSKPNTIAQWRKHGVTPKGEKTGPRHTEALAKLLTLEGKYGQEFWVAYPNFDVIKRYNQSNHYAMAVYLLSQELQARKISLPENMKKSAS